MNIQYFENIKSIEHQLGKGFIIIGHFNMEEYPGMVLSIILSKHRKIDSFLIDLEWSCFGLDPYGDTLQESNTYQFNSLNKALIFLEKNYKIEASKIPSNYRFNQAEFPNPITNADKKSIYERYWKQFQDDFKTGKFLIRIED